MISNKHNLKAYIFYENNKEINIEPFKVAGLKSIHSRIPNWPLKTYSTAILPRLPLSSQNLKKFYKINFIKWVTQEAFQVGPIRIWIIISNSICANIGRHLKRIMVLTTRASSIARTIATNHSKLSSLLIPLPSIHSKPRWYKNGTKCRLMLIKCRNALSVKE